MMFVILAQARSACGGQRDVRALAVVDRVALGGSSPLDLAEKRATGSPSISSAEVEGAEGVASVAVAMVASPGREGPAQLPRRGPSTGRCGRSRTRRASPARRRPGTISRPLSMSVWRHRRAVALDEERLLGLACPRARRCATPRSGSCAIDRRTRAHSGSAFGSKTTHCSPRSIDASMKISRRRTLTYFQSESLVMTRARPRRGCRGCSARKSRITLMLTGYGLRMSCSLLVELALQPGDAAHDLVGRRLVHAALDVGARVDADHVARRRHRVVADHGQVSGIRVRDHQPGVVERRRTWCRTAGAGCWTSAIVSSGGCGRRAPRSGSASARSGRSDPPAARRRGLAGDRDD